MTLFGSTFSSNCPLVCPPIIYLGKAFIFPLLFSLPIGFAFNFRPPRPIVIYRETIGLLLVCLLILSQGLIGFYWFAY